MPEVDNLRKEVEDRLSAIPVPISLPDPKGWMEGLLGYWFMEVLTDQTLSGSSEWTTTFEDTAEPRTYSFILTAGGWMPPQIVGGDDRPARLRVAWWNDGPAYPVDVTLDGDTLGGFQVVLNGQFTHYSSNQELTWNIRPGPNELSIMIGDGAERFTFSGTLWDGKVSRWMEVNWTEVKA